MSLYLGCPVWSFKGWVGVFYPPGTRSSDYLREYALRLNTIEGNTTFYATPARDTMQRWVEQTPDTFRFCPKLPRAVSHTGRLEPQIERTHQFIDSMSQLGIRLGPMFLQLPPSYSPSNNDDLARFLSIWPASRQLAVEVRHLDWFEDPHNERLNVELIRREMARVVIDTRPIRSLHGDRLLEGTVYQRMLDSRLRKPDVPVQLDQIGPFTFLRYIGHPLLEENLPFLEEWASCLAARLVGGSDCYVFCHCPDESIDPWLCRQLHHLVNTLIPLPSLPWDLLEDAPHQPRLF